MKMTRTRLLLIGIAATIGFAGLWHGPLGAGERFARQADAVAKQTMAYNLVPQIKAVMQRDPMARRILLSGDADEFQRIESLRIMDDVPGIIDVRWVKKDGTYAAGSRILPLAVEAQLLGLLGFLVGMIIMYLVELRRRANIYKTRI
nr:hypothetical protein [uncultured Sphingomonas sp.]